MTLAIVLLPGIALMNDASLWEGAFVGACVFLCVNQLVYSYPSAIRGASPTALAALAAIGILQDSLVWLLVSWLSSQLGAGLHVDGILPLVLGGLILRLSVLTCMALGPQQETA